MGKDVGMVSFVAFDVGSFVFLAGLGTTEGRISNSPFGLLFVIPR